MCQNQVIFKCCQPSSSEYQFRTTCRKFPVQDGIRAWSEWMDPEDVSSPVRRALRKRLVFKYQPNFNRCSNGQHDPRAVPIENRGEDRVLKLK